MGIPEPTHDDPLAAIRFTSACHLLAQEIHDKRIEAMPDEQTDRTWFVRTDAVRNAYIALAAHVLTVAGAIEAKPVATHSPFHDYALDLSRRERDRIIGRIGKEQ